MVHTDSSTKDNIAASFSKNIEFLESFTHEVWVNRDSVTSTGKICDTSYFEKAIYRVLHERNNITLFLKEHLECPEKRSFTRGIWVRSAKMKSTKKDFTLKIL